MEHPGPSTKWKNMEKLKQIHDDFRIFPKMIAGFIAWVFYEFHVWFMTIPPTEWGFVGYGVVLGTVVGFAKFYMESGCKK